MKNKKYKLPPLAYVTSASIKFGMK